MIVVRICGGLGNQLFQYAAGKQLSLINKTPLVLDLSSYHWDKVRSYRLDCFNISAHALHEYPLPGSVINNRRRVTRHIWYGLLSITPGYPWIFIREKPGQMRRLPSDAKKHIYLDGYWQHEAYFRNIATLVRKEFALRRSLSDQGMEMLNTIQRENAVSIHIRRTDYVSNPRVVATNGVCPLTYYHEAVELLSERVSQPTFFVFSDDISWARHNLKLDFPIRFVDIQGVDQDCQDLFLMSQCKHQIIANSTFSWWGAWLNSNPSKIVIAPQRWYSAKRRQKQQIVPSEWLMVP